VNTNTTTPAIDGKPRRQDDGSYVTRCMTLLDGKIANITYRTTKGKDPYSSATLWRTTATVSHLPGFDRGEYKVRLYGGRIRAFVKVALTKKEATDVFRLTREGFITDGDFAILARHKKETQGTPQ